MSAGDWDQFLDSNEKLFGSRFEKLFVEVVLAGIPDLSPDNVRCQAPFRDKRNRERRIDFTIEEGEHVKLALEVDGWDKTGSGSGPSRTEFTATSSRGLDLQSQGYTVLRFANSLVTRRPEDCVQYLALTLARERAKAAALDRSDDIQEVGLDQSTSAELAKLERTFEEEYERLEAELRDAWRKNRRLTSAAIATAVTISAMAAVVAIVLLRAPVGTAADDFCEGGVSWRDARSYIGRLVSVHGPVVETSFQPSASGQPTFVNLGLPFPDPDRLTVVVWGTNRSRFPTAPESLFEGQTICVSGTIEQFEGRVELELTSPAGATIRQ